MRLELALLHVKRSSGESQMPRLSEAEDSNGNIKTRKRGSDLWIQLVLTLSFAPSINFYYPVAEFDHGQSGDTKCPNRSISNDRTS